MEETTSNFQKFLRSEVSFYGTVIAAVFAIATMYFGLAGRMDLLAQRVEFFTSSFSDLDSKLAALDGRVANCEKDTLLIKTQLSSLQNQPK